MFEREHLTPKIQLAALRDQLVTWLVDDAYPTWAQHGIDPCNSGFVETLDQNALPIPSPRRARVQPRQIYSFALAGQFGWRGDVAGIVRHGINYFTNHYCRADGLFRTLVDVDGVPLDEQALLYDQAFALLGLASAATTLDARAEFEPQALTLRHAIEQRFRASNAGFIASEAATSQRESNPHMHLLEACLAWAAIGNDAGWADWAEDIVELAMTHFIHAPASALGEFFAESWQPAPGLAGRIVEPGHQFEWAWLLLRSTRNNVAARRAAALKLVNIGEHSGVRDGVAINTLLDDLSVHDANARLWPQTERIKAAALAAQLTAQPQYWSMAVAAIEGLLPYLNTPTRGLWFDMRLANGTLVNGPAPASTFYHVVCAIEVLDAALRASAISKDPT